MPRKKKRGERIQSNEVEDRLKQLEEENKKQIKNRELEIAFDKMERERLRLEEFQNELETKQQTKGREYNEIYVYVQFGSICFNPTRKDVTF